MCAAAEILREEASMTKTPSCSQESVHVALVRIEASSSCAYSSGPVSGIHEDMTLLGAQRPAVPAVN